MKVNSLKEKLTLFLRKPGHRARQKVQVLDFCQSGFMCYLGYFKFTLFTYVGVPNIFISIIIYVMACHELLAREWF